MTDITLEDLKLHSVDCPECAGHGQFAVTAFGQAPWSPRTVDRECGVCFGSGQLQADERGPIVTEHSDRPVMPRYRWSASRIPANGIEGNGETEAEAIASMQEQEKEDAE